MDTWGVNREQLVRIAAIDHVIAELGAAASPTASPSASPQPTASS